MIKVMSRILPIKKSLDDRYINETDVITEQALSQVIEGQGGTGGGLIDVNGNIVGFGEAGYELNKYFHTKEEAAAFVGITTDMLDQIIRGDCQKMSLRATVVKNDEGDVEETQIICSPSQRVEMAKCFNGIPYVTIAGQKWRLDPDLINDLELLNISYGNKMMGLECGIVHVYMKDKDGEYDDINRYYVFGPHAGGK